MRIMKLKSALLAVILLAGCAAKKPAVAPVPGSVNALDVWAYRIVSDSTAAVHSVKIWEQCSEVGTTSKSVNVDGVSENCDPAAGMFPLQYKNELNTAINALNLAGAAGKAYHSGASNDATGLTAAINQLSAAIGQLMADIGRGK